LRRELPPSATVITIGCDEGEKYLSDYFIPKPSAPAASEPTPT